MIPLFVEGASACFPRLGNPGKERRRSKVGRRYEHIGISRTPAPQDYQNYWAPLVSVSALSERERSSRLPPTPLNALAQAPRGRRPRCSLPTRCFEFRPTAPGRSPRKTPFVLRGGNYRKVAWRPSTCKNPTLQNAKIRLASKILLLVSFCAASANAQTTRPDAEKQLAHDIYKQFIEIQSGFTTGSTTPVAEAAAARLKAAGFSGSDIFVGGAIPKKANLVVRYHGTGARKPLLLLAHIDVVEAKREDWSTDPFQFLEKDGFFYGRGTG